MVAAYSDAEKAVLKGQSHRWGDRQLTRADLGMIRDGRKEWEKKLQSCLACANGATRQRFGGLNTSHAVLNQDSADSEGCCS